MADGLVHLVTLEASTMLIFGLSSATQRSRNYGIVWYHDSEPIRKDNFIESFRWLLPVMLSRTSSVYHCHVPAQPGIIQLIAILINVHMLASCEAYN